MTKRASLNNGILRRLPRKEFKAIFSKLELVPLPLHSVLNETVKPIAYCYFMRSGLASILTVLASGKIVEVGLTGAEGFVGLPLVAGLKSSASRVIVQVAGSAFRIRARDMIAALGDCPALRKSLGQFGQEVAVQSAQIAACNRLHNANQRLARWLLMSQDRLGGNQVRLTQEFLAHMLGMRRASVTVALGFLQKAGHIAYVRGVVRIEDRLGLEAAACECYASITQHQQRWRKESK
ncbi:MAG TPA: Crp/Fnr family transcriptional regulator [Candidatus Acidoferrales bacterium]|nr:Crp/Fnr family transcriptional regulator [Candidatus Acidoferrales bacterium]